MEIKEVEHENCLSAKVEKDMELDAINFSNSSNLSLLQSKIVNRRAATLYGIGEVKKIRHEDQIVVVKLPYGMAYCNFQSLLENPEEKIALEMERLMETGKECAVRYEMEQALNCYRKCVKIAPHAIHHFFRIRKLLSKVYAFKAECLLSVCQYQKALFALDLALKYNSELRMTRFRMVQIYIRLRKYKQASSCLRKIMNASTLSEDLKIDLDDEFQLFKTEFLLDSGKIKRIYSGMDVNEKICRKEKTIKTSFYNATFQASHTTAGSDTSSYESEKTQDVLAIKNATAKLDNTVETRELILTKLIKFKNLAKDLCNYKIPLWTVVLQSSLYTAGFIFLLSQKI